MIEGKLGDYYRNIMNEGNDYRKIIKEVNVYRKIIEEVNVYKEFGGIHISVNHCKIPRMFLYINIKMTV